MKPYSYLIIPLFFLLISCSKQEKAIEKPVFSNEIQTASELSKAELYDKVLGMLVGAAIGDAMGAPTEM